MVPFQVLNLMKSSGTLHSIRKLIIGGSEISLELEALMGPVATEVYATYGMAETCSHVALQRINGPAPQKGFYPLPGVSLSTDERDCLVIKASYLPHPVVTNDLVEFIAPGAFRWIGRYDNLINSGGIKIVPEEMEAGITTVIGVECAIIGLPDARLGQKAVLVLEKRLDRSEIEIKSILEKLYPRNIQPAIVWIEQFPRNDSYKLDRKRLATLIYGMI
jgi:O-succinylbenzoic acid--CoA ligase